MKRIITWILVLIAFSSFFSYIEKNGPYRFNNIILVPTKTVSDSSQNAASTAYVKQVAATINVTGGGGTSSETFVEPNDANYTIATGTGNLAVNYYNDLTADRTITMPTPASNTNRKFTIRNGSASFNLILSISIYENSSSVFSAIGPGQSITFYSNGTLFKRIY